MRCFLSESLFDHFGAENIAFLLMFKLVFFEEKKLVVRTTILMKYHGREVNGL